ncbi:PH domain-containing protein [Shewanella mangrovi]|uniref:PH domain-containing protein n=1 Tax=Shewanella mangrovi TaxID=1515746 RepID=UPI00069071A1|nr:PH domain-containing protein [Shewanella mangrovi]
MEHQTSVLAPLSTAAHWSFAGLIIFLIVIMLFIWQKPMPATATSVSAGLVIATVGFFGWMYWQANHATLLVAQTDLQIDMPLYGRHIALSDLDLTGAKVVDMQSQQAPALSWRTNGVGLPGYHLGWFQLKQDGKALVAVSDTQHVLFIPTKLGFSLLLSSPQASVLLQQLRDSQTTTAS